MEDKLAKIGITGKLFKLYMAAVELNEAPVQEVAARAGLARTTAYDVLQRLVDEELVRLEERNGRRFVIAEDPVVLLQRLEMRREVLGDIIPQIRSLYNRAKGTPQTRFYQGEEGVRTVLWDTLTCQTQVLRGMLSMGELIETPGLPEMEDYISERKRRGIHLRVLRSWQREVARIWPSAQDDLRELRYTPHSTILNVTQYIYDDKVAIISSKRENYGLLIESDDFANLQRTLFETLWQVSTPSEDMPQERQVAADGQEPVDG